MPQGQMPHSATSDLGLHCLPRSQKRDTRLIWVKGFNKHTYTLLKKISCSIVNWVLRLKQNRIEKKRKISRKSHLIKTLSTGFFNRTQHKISDHSLNNGAFLLLPCPSSLRTFIPRLCFSAALAPRFGNLSCVTFCLSSLTTSCLWYPGVPPRKAR